MKIFIKIITLVFAVVVLIWIFLYFAEFLTAPAEDLQSTICFSEKCFYIEVARTESERERGLMFRKNLSQNTGMLFVFDKEAIYPFWMKNTLISLDIIWIRKDKKIVFIKENAEPCDTDACPHINPAAEALYVLEINAGISENFGLKIGDSVDLHLGGY